MTRGKNAQSFGISLPNELVEIIDKMRGDVTRSRFIFRLIEKGLKEGNKKTK